KGRRLAHPGIDVPHVHDPGTGGHLTGDQGVEVAEPEGKGGPSHDRAAGNTSGAAVGAGDVVALFVLVVQFRRLRLDDVVTTQVGAVVDLRSVLAVQRNVRDLGDRGDVGDGEVGCPVGEY